MLESKTYEIGTESTMNQKTLLDKKRYMIHSILSKGLILDDFLHSDVKGIISVTHEEGELSCDGFIIDDCILPRNCR